MLEHITLKNSQSYSLVSLGHLISQKGLEHYLVIYILTKKADGLSERSTTDYQDKISKFIKLLDLEHPKEITSLHVRLFLLKLKESGRKSVTLRDYFVVIKCWLNWLVNEGHIEKNPLDKVPRPRIEQNVIQPFTSEQIKSLLYWCNLETYTGVRNKAIILTFLDTGLRLTELCSIKPMDINEDTMTIKVMGKGSKERLVAFGKTTLKSLYNYLLVRRQHCTKHKKKIPDCLWMTEECKPLRTRGVQSMIKRLGKLAGLKNVRCSPHTFRHTFGTSAMLSGASQREVQSLLGHATENMTKRYTETINSHHAAQRHKQFSPVDKLL